MDKNKKKKKGKPSGNGPTGNAPPAHVNNQQQYKHIRLLQLQR